ncbi:MAG: hypothetical protein IKL36_01925 [Clostridia bacterium]|nr:hypothetical protein [Clostridia bacterium]
MLNKKNQKRDQITDIRNDRLKAAKKNIYAHSIGLVVFIVVVTVTLLFAATTAWYTNTIAVNGLTFKAEAWGFDGSVFVSEEAIEAAPGDTGFVELRVKNKSDIASSVGINISKQYMEEPQMQKRIYFYIDKSAVVNGESVDKIYLNNTKGYSYTLYGHNELILSEQISTDVPVKWEWVYDVVGYYFKGSVSSAEGEQSIIVDEYLQPIQYSYDHATFDSEGNLLTVDGETTVDQYLVQLTANDGFKGAYSIVDGALMLDQEAVYAEVANCYPIDRENNIWVYLCTEAEIEANTVWDTLYGSTAQEEKKSYQARISVVGEQLNQKVVVLNANDDIAESLNANSGEIVRLSNDMTVAEPIAIGKAATDTEDAVYVNALLDLNDCEINITDTSLESVFDVAEGSSITVFNGELSGTAGSKAIGIKATGADVTLSNVTVSDLNTGVRINDNESGGINSTVIISDSSIEGSLCAVRVNGDGARSSAMTQVIIQDSTLISKNHSAIIGNGTAGENGNWGTNIQVVNSTLEGYYSAVYHPQMNSTFSAEGSVLKGMTGMLIKGGDFYISNSKVIGTATDDSPIVVPTEELLGNSGSLDTGDGIYIESNYGYPISLTVTGDSEISHTARTAKAIRVFPQVDYVQVMIDGGLFSSDVSAFITEDYQCVAEEVPVEGSEETVTMYRVSLKG